MLSDAEIPLAVGEQSGSQHPGEFPSTRLGKRPAGQVDGDCATRADPHPSATDQDPGRGGPGGFVSDEHQAVNVIGCVLDDAQNCTGGRSIQLIGDPDLGIPPSSIGGEEGGGLSPEGRGRDHRIRHLIRTGQDQTDRSCRIHPALVQGTGVIGLELCVPVGFGVAKENQSLHGPETSV